MVEIFSLFLPVSGWLYVYDPDTSILLTLTRIAGVAWWAVTFSWTIDSWTRIVLVYTSKEFYFIN